MAGRAVPGIELRNHFGLEIVLLVCTVRLRCGQFSLTLVEIPLCVPDLLLRFNPFSKCFIQRNVEFCDVLDVQVIQCTVELSEEEVNSAEMIICVLLSD